MRIFQKKRRDNARSSKHRVAQSAPETVLDDRTPDVRQSTPSIWDVIAPDGLVFPGTRLFQKPADYARFQDSLGGERFLRPFYLTRAGWPRKLSTGWLRELYSYGEIDTMVHISKTPRREAVRSLQNLLTILQTNLNAELKRGNIDQISDLETRIEDTRILRDEISFMLNDQYFVAVQAVLYSDSQEELDRQSKLLEDEMAGRQIHLRSAFLRLLDGWKSVLPLGINRMKDTYRNLDRKALGTLFPFASSELRFCGGIPLGINMQTGNQVFYNAFAEHINNYNLSVFGVSGSGKSFTIKALTARSVLDEIRSVLLDPEGEYRGITQLLGGIYVPLKEDTNIVINPCAMTVEEEAHKTQEGKWIRRKRVPVREKISELLGFFDVLMSGTGEGEGLNTFESAILDDCIQKYFHRLGINENAESLYEKRSVKKEGTIYYDRVRKPEPELSGIYETLIKEYTREQGGERFPDPHAERLIAGIRPYLKGNSRGIFDGQTFLGEWQQNDETALDTAPIICFDISQLEEGFLRPLAFHVCLTWTWEYFVKKEKKQKKRVVADEAWMLVDHEQTLKFLEKMSRRCRKRNASMTIASQDFHKFARNDRARAVLQNSSALLLLKQNAMDIPLIEDTFQMSQGEMEIILSAGPGEGVFRVGMETVWMQVDASKHEMAFLESNPNILSRMEAQTTRVEEEGV
ncbi:MAG: DUF87 domain-containing protein [Bacillaceae bacterium]|nr:DUF87 domain-containing protein [Bacillaceae bacterium]